MSIGSIIHNLVEHMYLHIPDLNDDKNYEEFCKKRLERKIDANYHKEKEKAFNQPSNPDFGKLCRVEPMKKCIKTNKFFDKGAISLLTSEVALFRRDLVIEQNDKTIKSIYGKRE